MAGVLKLDPAAYSRLQALRSAAGVTLARCIKPGVDNKGHPMVRTVGLVAGDPSCFEVFKDVFDPVIRELHPGFSPGSQHPAELEASGVSDLPLDESGSRVVSVQVAGSRSLSGGLRMPTAAAREELCEAERLLSGALCSLGGRLEGVYHPFAGMQEDEHHELRSAGLLFEEPDSAILHSAGYGRCWPHGRGVFVGKGKDFFAWVNEADHLKIFSQQPSGDLKQAFERFVCVERSLGELLKASGHDYAFDGRLGFLNSCPSNIGTALHVSATLRLPLLGARSKEFRARCKALSLQARSRGGPGGLQELSNYKRLGCSAVAQVNSLIDGCRELTALEARLAAGEEPSEVLREGPPVPAPLPAEAAGAGPAAGGGLAEALPDLAGKHSMAADVLRADPGIYERLKTQKTAMGVSLTTCIKSCLENSGHPMIKTIGAVAGDDLCYSTFKDFFDPVIKLRHPGWDSCAAHPTDLDWSKVSGEPLDPDEAGRVVSVRARIARNLQGIRMPPACSLEERREVERVVAQSLRTMPGEYFPLRGSSSYPPKPEGMSAADEERLEAEHLLFDEPDSQVLLSSGFGRDWPDARGVFVGEDRQLLVWVNESDHLRMQAMQGGSDLKAVFGRLCELLAGTEVALKATGHSFAKSSNLGFLGACPSNLGTCLAASAIIRIPLLSAEPQFRAICRQLRLQAHLGIGGGLTVAEGVWEVLNSDRLGCSEVEQVNTVISGCRALLSAESRLARGEALEPLPAQLAAPTPCGSARSHSTTAAPHDEQDEGYDEDPGLGVLEFPGFPADSCPEELPILDRHHSLMANVLKGDPSIYSRLRALRTSMDVSLARCIKTGMDNGGHPMISTMGLVAGDAECYDLFAPLFDPVIRERHAGFDRARDHHVSCLDAGAVVVGDLDPVGDYVTKVQVWVCRNVQGLKFPPAASEPEKIEAEKMITTALLSVPGLGGQYHPLRGSHSYAALPGDMSEETEQLLTQKGLMMKVPDSNVVLSTGAGKHWPKARGVFTADEYQTVAFVNQESHLRLRCSRDGADLRGTFARLCEVERGVREALRADSLRFAEDVRLGHLVTSLADLGTAMRAEVFVRLRLLPKRPRFKELCQRCNVIARATAEGGAGLVCVWNSQTLGSTEADQVNAVIRAVSHFVSLEAQLQQGREVDLQAPLPEPSLSGDEAVVERMRSRARSVLGHAANDGSLESALQMLLPQGQEADIEDVRGWARSTLLQAANDGRLESVLKEMLPERGEEKDESSESREMAKKHLLGALEDGRLQAAIETIVSESQAGQEDDSIDSVKERARVALRDALQTGDLEAIFQRIREPDTGQPEDDIHSMKDRARVALSDALVNGKLEGILQEAVLQVEEFSEDVPGLGSADMPGFPADACPEVMPDLASHNSIMATTLRSEPAIYESLKGLSTKFGVTLARCIKPGMDNKGHPMVKTLGLVAGDEECYELFESLFNPVISARHGGFDPSTGSRHPAGLESAGAVGEGALLDPSGRLVVSASVQAGRNVKGACFLPAASRLQRLEVHGLCVGALKSLGGDLAGEYTPLAGMDQAARSRLASEGLLFDMPDSPYTLASGFGRHWPEARGVFTNAAHTLTAWVNQEDHLLISASEQGAGIWEAFARFVRAEGAIQESLQSQGRGYARSEALGVLTADPSKAGSGGFQARVSARLNLVSGQADFKAVCKGLKVAVKESDELGVWSISKTGFLGQSEMEVVLAVAGACQKLVEMELALERGEGSA
ncbi:unnamed protein product [Prorocentrum cordatum]|nr:unnamed protein product [Polarella glacialis]